MPNGLGVVLVAVNLTCGDGVWEVKNVGITGQKKMGKEL